jgi:signal transduction histidine kinase
MLVCVCGISAMTVAMGGLSSPYYAGLTLAIVATGLLFVWPPLVVVVTHSLIVASFVVPNLVVSRKVDFASLSNLAFLVSTALIAGIGQTLLFRTHKEQLAGRNALELAKAGLERAAEDLKAVSRFKSQFFANITHELRTPLAMILTPLELLLQGEDGALSDAQRGTFSSMFKSGLKLLKMIGDLLDLSRLEESRLRLRISEQELVSDLRGLCAQIEGLAARKQIAVTLRSSVDRAFIWCDPERMERVFINLLSNAIKFTEPSGHIVIEVDETRDAAAQSVLRIAVQDDGPGFPPDKADKLFERFYQVEMGGTRRYGGTGIGLALAKELVELHGGSIRAESGQGKGARFTVDLRFGKAHFKPEALERRSQQRDVAGGKRQDDRGLMDWAVQLAARDDFRLLDIEEHTERRALERDPDEDSRFHTVLVVDDTPEIMRLVHLALRGHFKVLAAPDGAKGLALAERQMPSLIVTDLMMPGMSGQELVERLQANPLTKAIPVIMLTASAELSDKLRSLDAGVSAYLTKPFSSRELLSTARQLVHATDATADRLLAQRMDSLQIVAGGLAHEINNPLNYLKNALARTRLDAAKLLELTAPSEPRALSDEERAQVARLEARMRDLLGVAESGIKRIESTVSLMSTYGRAGYDRTPRPHDVFAASADVVRLVLPATGRKVRVETAFEGDGCVECVPQEVNQVLTNLIQNAIEAAPDEGGEVRVRGRGQGSAVFISVSDNGPGIRGEDRARLFTPFFTTKGPGKGTGLGLTIAYRVVQSLGGTLEVNSQPGGGAEFVMRVPRVQRERGDAATSARPNEVARPAKSGAQLC